MLDQVSHRFFFYCDRGPSFEFAQIRLRSNLKCDPIVVMRRPDQVLHITFCVEASRGSYLTVMISVSLSDFLPRSKAMFCYNSGRAEDVSERG